MILLGSTGSIGRAALEIARENSLSVEVLVAGGNLELLNRQIAEFAPKIIVVADKNRAHEVVLPCDSRLLFGDEGIIEAINLANSKLVLNALVGFRGLSPSIESLRLGKKLALANKESLVAGGAFIDSSCIIPVDSEHFSLWFLRGEREFSSLVITASGGAFRDIPLHEIPTQSVEAALRHPNWSMGRKITVDSASMANKLLEVIEAHWLFKTTKIDALIERNSLIHALIGFMDGSFSAHIARANMRLPLAYALLERVDTPPSKPLELAELPPLSFERIDPSRYPLWNLKQTLLASPSLGVIFNAANEVAVERFLAGDISFGTIAKHVEYALKRFSIQPKNIDEVFTLNSEVREFTKLL
ncbi:MAG: 1-deoxy-D-xylulose-5-phosphate reductoisomerase [Wolinella sp.]